MSVIKAVTAHVHHLSCSHVSGCRSDVPQWNRRLSPHLAFWPAYKRPRLALDRSTCFDAVTDTQRHERHLRHIMKRLILH
jgi:hypothetical protein